MNSALVKDTEIIKAENRSFNVERLEKKLALNVKYKIQWTQSGKYSRKGKSREKYEFL